MKTKSKNTRTTRKKVMRETARRITTNTSGTGRNTNRTRVVILDV
jgi:hypothetical protein